MSDASVIVESQVDTKLFEVTTSAGKWFVEAFDWIAARDRIERQDDVWFEERAETRLYADHPLDAIESYKEVSEQWYMDNLMRRDVYHTG